MATLPNGVDLTVQPGSARHPQTARPNCATCARPLHEFPHASFLLDGDAPGSEYHGEVRRVAAGFADIYVFGYGEFHVKASRVTLSDAVDG